MKKVLIDHMRVFSYLIIGTIPIPFAAVQPWVWSFYSLLMIAAFVLYLWLKQENIIFSTERRINIPVILFFTYTIFFCLPLPGGVISFLSPVRYESISTAQKLTGIVLDGQSLSYYSLNAFSWWVFLLSLYLFFNVVRYLSGYRKFLKIILFIIFGLGITEALYGLIQALVPSMGVLWVDYVHDYMGNARGTFINRNHFAGFVELIWPLVLGVTLSMTDRKHSLKRALASDLLNRQALMALGIVVLLLALLLSRSRAGIAGGLIGLLTFWYLARPNIRHITLHARILIGGVVVFLCIYCLTIGVGPILERFFLIDDVNSRIDIWRDSLSILKDHPLGIGLRNYENVFEVYNQSIVSDKKVMHAHNDYLQLMIETGWIGFICLLSAFISFIARSFQVIRRLDPKGDPMRFFLAIGSFSGLISLAFHSFLDFNLQIPANILYFVTLMAILSSCTEKVKCPQRFTNTTMEKTLLAEK
jgi:O-antigen ligase